MANIDRIVSVQIALSTTAIKEKSFSDLLVVGPHALSVGRVMVVTGADQLLEMGVDDTDPLYMAVRDVFKQIPTINQVYIGRAQADDVDITVTKAVVGNVYTLTIGWRDTTTFDVITQQVSYTALVADTDVLIAAGLAAAVAAVLPALPVTAVATGPTITISSNVPGDAFSVTTAGALALVTPVSTESMTDALAAIRAENDDWYGIVLTSRDEADQLDAAQWTEANEKLLGISSNDPGILDGASTTDIAAKLQQGQFFRTHVWFHRPIDFEWLESAIAGNRFTFYPGGETWANTRLAGITYDTLAEGESIAARNKNANTFEPFRNFAITQGGKVAAGEWIDVIRFRDWLAEQIKINVVSTLINADGKVPYTDPGIQLIVAAMRKALDLGVSRGGIAPEEHDEPNNRVIPSYLVEYPASVNVPFNDKANRILKDVKFTARLAGAIHVVEIKGNLTYAL
ncbi:MAG TPA: DUF3383 family protein [Pseudolabrys sp.]|jgi:hypothetical protein|nr:DUF3383 family protein [Pseudolabrys sp.]